MYAYLLMASESLNYTYTCTHEQLVRKNDFRTEALVIQITEHQAMTTHTVYKTPTTQHSLMPLLH